MLPTILLLALGPLVSGAALTPRLDDTYGFTLFQAGDCSNYQGNVTIQGKTDDFPVCSPPLEYTFGSVLVTADADKRCSITFFNQTIEDDQCRGPVSTEPGSMTLGECFTFDAANRPITYGIVCG